jgi:hypothetical protein
MTTRTTKLSAWDRIMMAITFAEENEPETARDILNPEKVEKRPETRKETDRRPELRV